MLLLRSVRARMTLWSVGVVALALVLFSLTLRVTVQRFLMTAVDRDLRERARGPAGGPGGPHGPGGRGFGMRPPGEPEGDGPPQGFELGQRLPPGPEGAREQLVVLAPEPPGPPRLDEVLEGGMDIRLQAEEMFNVFGLLRAERVQHGFRLARRMDPPLDPQLPHRLDEAETGGNDADRADHGTVVGEDLVTRAGQPVAA